MKNRAFYILYGIIYAIICVFLFLSTMALFPLYMVVYILANTIYWVLTGEHIDILRAWEWVDEILHRPFCNLGYHEFAIFSWHPNRCVHCNKEIKNEKQD